MSAGRRGLLLSSRSSVDVWLCKPTRTLQAL